MQTFLRDFRHGLRLMAGSPGVTAVAVLALALGIGANTAIFSVVYNVLLAGLPVNEPGRLVSFRHYVEARKLSLPGCAYADVVDWRTQMPSFEHIAAVQNFSANLSTEEEPERAAVSKVSANFFPMLGVRPVLGRGFLPEEDRPGAGTVAILSHGLWKRRFNADTNVAGAQLKLDGEPYTVIGVLPEGFRFVGQPVDVYTPLAVSGARGGRPIGVNAYGRLKPGVARDQVKPELAAATEALRALNPRYKGAHIRIADLDQWIVTDVRVSLWVLLGAVGLVLLIACANVAGLLLSRAEARRREMAIRAAHGAGRSRLILQLLAESAPLGLAGGILGLLLAWWGVQLLPLLETPRVPRLGETRVEAAVLAFTLGISLLTTFVFGLVPALTLSRKDLHETLKEGGRSGTSGTRGSRVRAVLVSAEVALALMLSIGATLMIRTFYTLSQVNPGFDPSHLLTASLDLPRSRIKANEQLTEFYRQVAERIERLPGVVSVALTTSLPLGGNYFRGDFAVQGAEGGERPHMLDMRIVDANYFRTLRIPVLKGRVFEPQDRIGSPAVAVISQATARRLFGDRDPIGARIGVSDDWMTVIGVAADVRHTDVSQEPASEVLLPFAQRPSPAASFVVRLDSAMYSDPAAFAPLLRRAVAAVSKDQAVYRVAGMEKIMADRLTPRRLNMLLMCMFAGLALLLAAVGVYGVLSFSVERRTHEIGIRMALGARETEVLRMVVQQALLMAAAGVAIGTGASLALTRVLRSLLYGVSATEPAIFAGAAALLMAMALLAGYLPARRAARVDPMAALRHE